MPDISNRSPLHIITSRMITPREVRDVTAVISSDAAGRIANIETGEVRTNEAARVIDWRGLTVLPGFVDLHIHGAIGVDVTGANAAQIAKVGRYLATQGTTAWLPTFVPAQDEEYKNSIAAIDEVMRSQATTAQADDDTAGDGGARIVGVHYEGPFVNEAQCGALRTQYFKTYNAGDDLEFMHKLEAANAVHLTTVAPEIANGINLIRELKRRGFTVSIGHTRADEDVLDDACAAGARHVTHLFNAMSGIHHRAHGVALWALTNDAITCDFIADEVHVTPRALQLIHRCKGTANSVLISDAVLPAGLSDGKYGFWDEQIKVVNGKTENQRGGIAGSVITLLDAVRVMRRLGVPMVEVARMAATNPARVVGLDNETGSIETGKRADLVAIDDAGAVVMTVIGGRVVYQKS